MLTCWASRVDDDFDVFTRESLDYDRAPNRLAEVAVREIKRHMRVVSFAFQAKAHTVLDVTHPIVSLLPRLCSFVVSKSQGS